LTYDRFLNVMYYEMLRRLEVDQKNPRRPRRELDNQLQVGAWRLPGSAYRQRRETVNAPAWWRGDEDASQTFLHAMGVVSLK
jgi:hypothetical protein